MSLADTAIGLTSAAMNVVHADRWRILSGPLAGTDFEAIAESEPPNVLETELGTDSRERTFLYITRPAVALQRSMQIEGIGAVWKVVGEVDDNPTKHWVKYELQKLSALDS